MFIGFQKRPMITKIYLNVLDLEWAYYALVKGKGKTVPLLN
jgi:hypothetical protein